MSCSPSVCSSSSPTSWADSARPSVCLPSRSTWWSASSRARTRRGSGLSVESHTIELIATFGLILLLFNLGLEFDQEEFYGNAGKLLVSGGTYVVINMGVGFAFGFSLGWGTREALIIAGMTATSSSAIVTKLLIELRRLANDETPDDPRRHRDRGRLHRRVPGDRLRRAVRRHQPLGRRRQAGPGVRVPDRDVHARALRGQVGLEDLRHA
ncbi:cation:proton antiporter [Curtobacterium flaccumfaciens]|nr:cation:proton antiporter [Curtobacterium flaccumfaciens]